MLIPDRIGIVIAWSGVLLLAAVLLGYRNVKRRHGGKSFMGFPVSYPMLPLVALAALLGPAAVVGSARRVCIVEGDDGKIRYRTYRIVGAASHALRTGQSVGIALAGDAKYAIVNDSGVKLALRRVHYSRMDIPDLGPKVVELIAPGTVAYTNESEVDPGGAPEHVRGHKYDVASRLELVPAEGNSEAVDR